MIHFVNMDDGHRSPEMKWLMESMFRDRAFQFRDRLNWAVTVDADGFEKDEYDDAVVDPIYVIWKQEDGSHGGSMRILPTNGPTMVNDHFLHLNRGKKISDARVWECTRFCISPRLKEVFEFDQISGSLMLAGCEFGIRYGLTDAVGVFDNRMIRIYKKIGWVPEILGSQDGISLGIWPINEFARAQISHKSGISDSLASQWFN